MTYRTQLMVVATALAALLAPSCTEPDISDYPTGRAWRCESHSDCGAGWVCDGEARRCTLAYDGTNGVFADRLVIGMSADFGGPNKETGLALRQGIEAYFNHVNTVRGGVNGRMLELDSRNDNYSPDTALENVKAMTGADRDVFAFLGNQGAPTAAVTAPYLNSEGVVLFGPYTGGSETRNAPPDHYVFNFRASYSLETRAIVDYMIDLQDPSQPIANIAVFAQGDQGQLDSLGQAGFDGVATSLHPRGVSSGEIFAGQYQRGTNNVSEAASGFMHWLGSADRTLFPDGSQMALVVLASEGAPAAEFVATIKDDMERIQGGGSSDFGLNQEEQAQVAYSLVVFAAASSVGDEMAQVLRSKDPSKYCSWVILSQVVPFYESGASGTTAYREQMLAYDPNATFGHVSLESYLTARLFVNGLEAAGPYLTDEVLVGGLESLADVDLGIGVPVTLSPHEHQASDEVWGTFLDENCVVREHPYHQQQAAAQ